MIRLLLLVFLSFTTVFGVEIPYKLEVSSHYPGVKAFYVDSPHIYKGEVYFSDEVLPYFYYSQAPNTFEIGLGSLLDYSFQNELFHHTFLKSGAYTKLGSEPVELKAYVTSDVLYADLVFKEKYGVSVTNEIYESSIDQTLTNEFFTVSLFGEISFFSQHLKATVHSLSSSFDGQINDGVGYQLSWRYLLDTFGIKHDIGATKFKWSWTSSSNDYSYTPDHFYFHTFYKRLDTLKETSTEDYLVSYFGSLKVEKVLFNWSYEHIMTTQTYLGSIGLDYEIDNHLGLKMKAYHSSEEEGIKVLLSLVVVHFLRS